ncbi:hypothetical protein [Candidatus Clostridium stratigraminis]|uniref:DUF4179 domain-containing protein n=1 Tax=Candidatus Clostridium stratigraminis TaxID=3381661 RepID=A0ABW8T9M4_9CLOT
MEDKLRNTLDKLNEEETSFLLDKDINFNIDKKAISKIKSSVYKKIGTNRKPSIFSRKLIACAAAVMLIFFGLFTIGFDNVAAAVRQVIVYIPGFGLASKDTGKAMLEVKVMKEPVFFNVQGKKVELYSSWLSIYNDQVIVTAIFRYPKTIDINEIAIEYNGGKIYWDSELPDFSSLDDKKNYKEITYTYTIRNPKAPIDSLSFDVEGSKVSIPFEKSEDIKDKVVSQNFNGIIVSAIPLNEDRSKFTLNSTYEKDMEGVNFYSSIVTDTDSKIKAIDEYGNEYEIKKSTPQGNEYYVDGNIKGKIVSLKFNKLYQGFSFENKESLEGIKFKVPKAGEKVEINKSLNNSISSINIKSVEKIAPNANTPYNLMFTYEIKSKIPGLNISYFSLYVGKTGGAVAGRILGKNKAGDSYIVNYGVLADENAAENTVNLISTGSYYINMMLLDKECILKFQ